MPARLPLAAAAICAALLGPPAAAQNIQVLAQVDRFPGGTQSTNHYAGICGTVSQGRELAVVPARTGTLFYDCTDPRQPVEVAFVPGPGPSGPGYFWREAAAFGRYVYISSEHGPFQVVDVQDPARPTLVGTFGGTSHTVSIDPATGLLYASGGAGRGIVLHDLNQDPIQPPQVGRRSAPYVHDCLPVRGHVYTAQMFDGSFGIVDVSNPANLVTLSTTPTPSAFPHNVAVSDDDRLAIVTEERRGDCMALYDISNKAAPRLITRWCSPNGATVHNVFLAGKVAHLACYADGYWAIDVSDPSNPTPIGQLDTSAFRNNDYNGNWGCYPYQPSGVVYLSDMQSGFWIVDPGCGVPHHYGRATAGSGGIAPRIDYDGGHARVGNPTFALVGDQLLGGATAALVLGAAPGSTPLLGIELSIDPLAILDAVTTTASGPAGAAGAGAARYPLAIPQDPGLAGAALHYQLITIDLGGPQGLAASGGMRIAICP
jgi:choice-of-anchor B domain-containing protein